MTERSVRMSIIILVGSVIIVMIYFLLAGPERRAGEDIAALTNDFMTCVPASLTQDQRQEVVGMLARFRMNANAGKVAEEDQNEVVGELKRYIQAGTISKEELNYFMARVGYLTYRSDPGANLPGGQVDHPLLDDDSTSSG